MNLKGLTAFSGGEGVGIAMRQCGIQHTGGVEYDDAIANVARRNGFDVTTADVRNLDVMRSFERPDVFHASPVCKNASTAKADGEESAEDIETAGAVCAYLDYFKPALFTLENVYGYRTFQAFANICQTLRRNGYQYEYWHLNSADYGVAQTRRRLILVARRDGKRPVKPNPTHTEKPLAFFDTLKPWVGWYEAIEDLLDTLPPSRFAKWQLERLPKDLRESAIFGNDQSDDHKGTEHGYGVITRRMKEPSITIKASSSYLPKAFLVRTGNTKQEWGKGYHNPDEPTMTISTGQIPRAFLMQVQGEGGDGLREAVEPMQSVTANHGTGKYRAFLVGDQYGQPQGTPDRTPQIAAQSDPAPVVRAREKGGAVPVAYASGRVVKMTPRALARFQSVPDDYILPDNNRLACAVLGNMVPPLLYRRVLEANLPIKKGETV